VLVNGVLVVWCVCGCMRDLVEQRAGCYQIGGTEFSDDLEKGRIALDALSIQGCRSASNVEVARQGALGGVGA